MEPAQARRAWDALTAFLWASQVAPSSSREFDALASRLEPGDAKRAWDDLIAKSKDGEAALIANSKNGQFKNWQPAALASLARRMDPLQTKQASDALIAILEKPRRSKHHWTALTGSAALCAADGTSPSYT